MNDKGSVFFTALVWLVSASFALVTCLDCPPPNLLEPYCFCIEGYYGAGLYCKDIFNVRDLLMPVEACRNRNVTALGISDSTLQYLPHDLFKGTRIERISFLETQLMSLSNSPLAFEGLEDTLEEIRAQATQYTALWRFRQLRELRNLRLIDINNILMESFSERLPAFKRLTAFGLIKAGIDYLDDEVLADCKELQIFDIRHNHLSELKRSMLPNPAFDLNIIALQDNRIEVLPNDFFDNMPKIMDVNLGQNRITTLDERTFSWLYKNVQTLDLTGNSIRCDCRMSWLVDTRSPPWLHAVCTEPESLKGRKLSFLTHHDVLCVAAPTDS